MIFRRLGLILNMEARRGAAPSKTSLPPRLRKERGIKGVRLIHKDQCGFTMIEMVIAIAIVGLIAGGITMTTFQVLEGSARSSNHTIAVRQVHIWLTSSQKPGILQSTSLPMMLARTT